MQGNRIYIVPHSHWDREWYFTIEDSNIILIENMDHLIQVLEEKETFNSFVFDGQLSIIEEYLAVRPEKKERLKKLIEEKRLLIGPWYTQADSLLVDKESLVRNLLYGVLGAEEMGYSMKIGYLPDIFGQNMYLPSLFQHFGIEYSILRRGVNTDELDDEPHFNWKSPDNYSVKTAFLPFGYGPGQFLETGETYVKETLYPLIEKINHMSHLTKHILFPAGGDQVLVKENMPEMIDHFNQLDDGNEYVLSDYETYMEETWREDEFTHSLEGELIGTELSRIHRTISSQRYDIKYWNAKVEHKLIHQLEPLSVMGNQLGLSYPKQQLKAIWKELFDVHAHDSIGGCNSDETNQAIIERLKKINRQVDGLTNIIKKQLSHAINDKSTTEDPVVVFNTSLKPQDRTVEFSLFTRSEVFHLKNSQGKKIEYSIKNQKYIDGGKKIEVTDEGDIEVPLPGYYRTEVVTEPIFLPSLGYTTVEVKEEEQNNSTDSTHLINSIENKWLKVAFENDIVTLVDKKENSKIAPFIEFEDTADAGDSYDYSPLVGETAITFDKAELVETKQMKHTQKMVVNYEKNLPTALSEREKKNGNQNPIKITTTLELRADEDFVRVNHKVVNQTQDHRLRVLHQAPIKQAKYSYGDQGYSLIKRAIEEERLQSWKEKGYTEAPVPIYTIERFAGVTDGENVLTAYTKGIKEYEIVPETNQLGLTLFRSVGLLGRDDLAWRPGRASGINNKVVETPDAQMIGEWTFDYAVQIGIGSGEPDATELFRTAEQFNEQYVTYQKQNLNTFEERLDRFEIPYPISNLNVNQSLIKLDNKQVFVSSCKQAEKDENIVVRLYNPSSEEQVTQLVGSEIEQVHVINIKEEILQKDVDQVQVPSKGYQTVQITMH